jgi:hypothetical protein
VRRTRHTADRVALGSVRENGNKGVSSTAIESQSEQPAQPCFGARENPALNVDRVSITEVRVHGLPDDPAERRSLMERVGRQGAWRCGAGKPFKEKGFKTSGVGLVEIPAQIKAADPGRAVQVPEDGHQQIRIKTKAGRCRARSGKHPTRPQQGQTRKERLKETPSIQPFHLSDPYLDQIVTVAHRCSASRTARATMVSVGGTCPPVGNTELPTT